MGAIIVGVDGSETAGLAAARAARLAAALDQELIAICAYGRFEVERPGDDDTFTISTEQTAEHVAADAIRGLLADHPGLRAVPLAAAGSPADALLAAAAEHDADVIVVGNKRVQGVARILGSVATEVARRAPCDVYVAYTHQR